MPAKTLPLSPAAAAPSRPALLPLGALAAGFGLALSPAMAQQTAPAAASAASAASASEPVVTLPTIRVKAEAAEPSGKQDYQATTTRIGKGKQELRDVPQSVTVVTEKLLDDRNIDTMKEALHQTAGISFQAAEGGEEDIRLRGFSLQSTGDIFIDGMRDPAFYERDSFNWDRLELLRGSASMLFGRGSTGGAVNQVTKQPQLSNDYEVSTTLGTGNYMRSTLDFNQRTGETTAVRINTMLTQADNYGNRIDNKGIAPTIKYGIGTDDELSVGLYHLENDTGIQYGLPWLTPGAGGGNYLWPTDARNYYGLASDYLRGGTTQGNVVHTHKFSDNSELRTAFRQARYTRDQRASAIRFRCVRNGAGVLPAGCVDAVNSDNFGDSTELTRSGGTGVQAKIMNMDTQYLQSDYSGKFKWGGLDHSVQAGGDYSHEQFENFGVSGTLVKPPTTVGSPNDGASIDEGARTVSLTRTFDMKALGVYVQDLVQVAPKWKVLAGLRLDKLDGRYHAIAAQGQPTTGTPPVANPCYVPANTRSQRDDSLWSKRFGVLYQPTATQSYHFSYGTSFNTSGDTYQYDPGTVNTPPESSRNIELGAKLDNARGDLSTRFAIFHTTKYNERNRDSETVNACNYVLSGERHAAGIEMDIIGRITPEWEVFGSYAFIPNAEVDSSSGAAGTEAQGSRPGLTPRHSGTIWTTYKVLPKWRIGGGLNARSADRPVGLAAGSAIVAPRYITGDLMTEFQASDVATFKLNVTNVTDEHYADMLYRGHYIPGKGRTVQLNMTLKF
ncbi:TonB-dependent siderophore receptor [Piscinibacter gummiphilus]|uniref:TonB-dependent siderophore receptor n=1 Tax=Piscinibacter gummiphilus TaxID=946333 RepID=A0ABZ0CUA8_9BURK|nr:TonB-dependent siderophore receptor [Piscinibacter gummiphilus]WOB08539.1 TonB-dependent siderophore receptor [Piscinibacter gummiphilus]